MQVLAHRLLRYIQLQSDLTLIEFLEEVEPHSLILFICKYLIHDGSDIRHDSLRAGGPQSPPSHGFVTLMPSSIFCGHPIPVFRGNSDFPEIRIEWAHTPSSDRIVNVRPWIELLPLTDLPEAFAKLSTQHALREFH